MPPTSPSRRRTDALGIVKLLSWVVVIGFVLAVAVAGVLAFVALF